VWFVGEGGRESSGVRKGIEYVQQRLKQLGFVILLTSLH
jgi:hypothetical protein